MESHTNNNTTSLPPINLPSTQRRNNCNNSHKTRTQSHSKGENVDENGQGPMIVESVLEPSDVYLVLASYAEPHKQAIKNIVAAEKAKLCSNSLFKTCFENTDFKIAFANSKNIKQMVVRTEI